MSLVPGEVATKEDLQDQGMASPSDPCSPSPSHPIGPRLQRAGLFLQEET